MAVKSVESAESKIKITLLNDTQTENRLEIESMRALHFKSGSRNEKLEIFPSNT